MRLCQTRLQEHKKDENNTGQEIYIKNATKMSASTINMLSIIDHATK